MSGNEFEEICRKFLELDFGHSGINPLQTRQERGCTDWKFGEVFASTFSNYAAAQSASVTCVTTTRGM
jgi:hypothetical protein